MNARNELPPGGGILNLNKPAGWTSRDAVNVVARAVRPAKAGHAGTLDPLAHGVLVVCVGAATRLIEYVQQMPKRYRAEFLLGRSSASDDVESPIVELPEAPAPSRPQLEQAAGEFLGQIMQRPPAFSALKVNGRRAYDLARRGTPALLAPRPVTIYRLAVVDFDYPRLTLEMECSSGTYVRALGRDLAARLGTAAVMSALCRTAVGSFHIDDALDAATLTRDAIERCLQPPRRAVETLPLLTLPPPLATRLRHGQLVAMPERPPDMPNVDALRWAVLDEAGDLIGIAEAAESGSLRPVLNLPAAVAGETAPPAP